MFMRLAIIYGAPQQSISLYDTNSRRNCVLSCYISSEFDEEKGSGAKWVTFKKSPLPPPEKNLQQTSKM